MHITKHFFAKLIDKFKSNEIQITKHFFAKLINEFKSNEIQIFRYIYLLLRFYATVCVMSFYSFPKEGVRSKT